MGEFCSHGLGVGFGSHCGAAKPPKQSPRPAWGIASGPAAPRNDYEEVAPSAATGMHLAAGIGAEALELIEGAAVRLQGALLGAAVGADTPGLSNQLGEFIVRS